MMGKTDKIIESVIADVEAAIIHPDQKLPSVRKMAEAFGASKNIVIDAYDKLTGNFLRRFEIDHRSGYD